MRNHIIVLGVCVLIAVIAAAAYVTISGDNANEIAMQQSTIDGVDAEIFRQKNANEFDEQTVVEDASGMSFERVNKDNEVAKDFLERVTTWDNYEQYMAQRDSIIKEFKLSEDSRFLTTFMPHMEQYYDEETGEPTFNYIDRNHLNMKLGDIDARVINVDGDKYSYFTVVEVSSVTDTGIEGTTKCAFLYTVDADGTLSNIDGMLLVD